MEGLWCVDWGRGKGRWAAAVIGALGRIVAVLLGGR